MRQSRVTTRGRQQLQREQLLPGAGADGDPVGDSGSLYNYLQQINATFFGSMLAVVLAALFTTASLNAS